MASKMWDPESPSLLPTIVCYADILGFRNHIEQAFELGEEKEFLTKIKGSLAALYEKVREAATFDGAVSPIFDMKAFTDNIVVAYPLLNPTDDFGEPELGAMLMLFAQVQASLAADGFILRGAIAAGQHYQDRDIVFGKALLEATELDKSGGPPRLVIAPSAVLLLSKHLSWYAAGSAPQNAYLLEDPSDGRLFVNYLWVAFEHFPDGPINHEFLATHRKMVCENLLEYESDVGVWKKYIWLATYHNYVCQSFADQFPTGGDEEAFPEVMAIRAEAQGALDHLVPCKKLPSDQAPRRLDAQRLQQHLGTI